MSLRINRRPSGGRGEYEISGAYHSIDTATLEKIPLHLVLDHELVINTGAQVLRQGGKPRIRLLPGTAIHPHRQIAAALFMPHPV